MPALHGARENHAPQFPRGDRWQHAIKEDPNVATLPGTRTLQDSGHTQLLAGLKESLGVIFPRLLVEVRRKKPARFVGQEGVHANGFLAQEVVLDNAFGQGRNFRVFWSTFFRCSGRLLLMAFQSFTAAGTYPDRPSAFSHRRA